MDKDLGKRLFDFAAMLLSIAENWINREAMM